MTVYFVDSDLAGGMYGPFSSEPLANIVLKIVQMVQDETAELVSFDMDPWGDKLLAGLRPFKVEIFLLDGKFQSVEVALYWPPLSEEGLVSGREDYQEYFVWAKTANEAKIKAARFASQSHATAAETGEAEEMLADE